MGVLPTDPAALFNLAAQPSLATATAALGLSPEAVKQVTGAGDIFTKIQAFIAGLTKAPGDALFKEPSLTGSAATAIQAVTAALPGGQALSLETAKYITGAANAQAALTPVMLMSQGAWAFLNGGGLAQLTGLLDQLSAGLNAGIDGLGKLASAAKAALEAALAGIGKTLADLSDPATLEALTNSLVVQPVEGLNDTALPLGEFLSRLMAKLPVVGVPDRPGLAPSKPLEAETTVTEIVTPVDGLPYAVTRVNRVMEIGSPVISTDLVPVNLSTPPKVNLVNTNQFQYDPDPTKTWMNPTAALENDIALAADIQAVAAQHAALAESSGDLADAAGALANFPMVSLRLSLTALLKGLVSYNFQTTPDGSLEGTTGRSLRWWSQYEPPALAVESGILLKLASGQPLTEPEITAYNAAGETLTARNDAVAERRFGALPGTLVWAALAHTVYTGTLGELLVDIPRLIAVAEDLSPTRVSTLQSIIFNLGVDDRRVEEIPDLFLRSDTRIDTYADAVKRFVETLAYLRDLPQATVASLVAREHEFGGGAISLVSQVKAMAVPLGPLYNALIQDRLVYTDRIAVEAQAAYWDLVTADVVINPNIQAPEVVVFLTELLAPRGLLPEGVGMATAMEELRHAVYVLGGPLGQDLYQLVGVVGTVLRLIALLRETMPEVVKLPRITALLTSADLMATPVARFPNPGLFGRIAEALQ